MSQEKRSRITLKTFNLYSELKSTVKKITVGQNQVRKYRIALF